MKKNLLSLAIITLMAANVFAQTITCTISNINNATCYNICNGSATANSAGGYAPYTYTWTPGGQTTKTAVGLCAGTYTVTTIDSTHYYGYGTATVTITQPTALTASSVTSTIATCNFSNGTATVNPSGGTAPYTYSWSSAPMQVTQTASLLPAGNYTVTVTDAHGCTKSASVTITQPPIGNISVTGNDSICFGDHTTITANVMGGTPPFTYSWNPGPSFGSSIAVSPSTSTNYVVTITDANGCTSIAQNIHVVVLPPPNINASATSYCVMNPTQLMATGTTIYNWTPSSGLSCTTCANPTANPSVTTTYTLFDKYGCPATSITVNVAATTYPQICITLVDTLSKHNIIVWNKPGSQGTIDSFRIYREVASFFTPIVNLPYSHLSMYTDTASSVIPNTSSYKYRISTISTAGVESALSNVHETMFLQVTQSAPPIANLTWTDYCGFPVTKYYIYRDGYNTGNWIKIDSANWGTNVFVDPNAPTTNSAYKIEVIPQYPCIASVKNPSPNSIALNSSRSNVYRINNANAVNEKSLNDLISIYPNPTNGQFNLKMNQFEDLKINGFVIYNLYGAKVYSNDAANFQINSSSNFQIDLGSQPSGIYFLQIKTPDRVVVKKIVKE